MESSAGEYGLRTMEAYNQGRYVMRPQVHMSPRTFKIDRGKPDAFTPYLEELRAYVRARDAVAGLQE